MKLEVTDLGYRESKRYPYSHRVEILETDKIEEVRNWVYNTNIPHSYIGSVFYFSKKDLIPFLLRWS
jgi:hypothetical protein